MSQWLSATQALSSFRLSSAGEGRSCGLSSWAWPGLTMCNPNAWHPSFQSGYLYGGGASVRSCRVLKLPVQSLWQSGRDGSCPRLRSSNSAAWCDRQKVKLLGAVGVALLHTPHSSSLLCMTAAGRDGEALSTDPENEESSYGGNYDLEMAIFEFMEQSDNPNAFPTKRQLLQAGRRDLVAAIEAEGGWLTIGWDSEGDDGRVSTNQYQESGNHWDVSSNGSGPVIDAAPSMPADIPVTRLPSREMDGAPGRGSSLPVGSPPPQNGTFGQQHRQNDDLVLTQQQRDDALTQQQRNDDLALAQQQRNDDLALTQQQRQVSAPQQLQKNPQRGNGIGGPVSLPRPVVVTGGRMEEETLAAELALSQQGQVASLEGYENQIKRAMRGIGENVVRKEVRGSERGAKVVVEPAGPREWKQDRGGESSGVPVSTVERGQEEATISGRGVSDSIGSRRKLRSGGVTREDEDAFPPPAGSARNDRWMPGGSSQGSALDNLKRKPEEKVGWEAVKSLFGLKDTSKIKPAPNPKARSRSTRPQPQANSRVKGPGATGSKAEIAPVVDRWEPPRRALDFSTRGSSPVSVWRPDSATSPKSTQLTAREEAEAVVKRRRKRRKKKTAGAPPGTDRWQPKDPPRDSVEATLSSPTAVAGGGEKVEGDAPNAGPATLRSRSDLSGMAQRIKALETKLAATRTALQSGRESLLQTEQQFKQVRDKTVEELVRVTDSLEFREGDIIRTRNELRSTKAQVAALEGKIATDIREAKQVLQDRQNRLAEAQAALKELRSTRVVWSEPAADVMLAGSFDGWSNRVKMEKSNAGVFVASLQLYPGRYEVKFIVDGSWRVDPRRPIVYSGGNENNVIIIN